MKRLDLPHVSIFVSLLPPSFASLRLKWWSALWKTPLVWSIRPAIPLVFETTARLGAPFWFGS